MSVADGNMLKEGEGTQGIMVPMTLQASVLVSLKGVERPP